MRTSIMFLGCALAISVAASLPAGPPGPSAISSEAAWRASDPSQLRRARLVRIDDTPRRQQAHASRPAHENIGPWLLLLTGIGTALVIAGCGIRAGLPGQTLPLTQAFAKFTSALRAVSPA